MAPDSGTDDRTHIRKVRRFELATITCLHGIVACGSIWGFEDPIPVSATTGGSDASSDAGSGTTPDALADAEADGGPVVDTPPVEGDPTKTCVPLPPVDWQGPLIIFEGTGTPLPDPPTCPSGYRSDAVYDGNGDLLAPPAQCTCACEPETGADCAAKVTFFKEKDCTNPCAGVTGEQTIGKTCAPSPACGGGKLKTTYTPGTCAPKTTAKNTPPAAWKTRARVCIPTATSTTGCEPGRVATPTTSLPFATNTYCIAITGESECPVASYPRKRVFYASLDDARDCSCTCAAPQGGSCTGAVVTADNNACGGDTRSVTDFECHETKKDFAVFNPVQKPGSCVGEPHSTGNATPATPTTICCTR